MFISNNFFIFLFYVNKTSSGSFLHTVVRIHAICIISVIFLCMVGLETPIDAQRNLRVFFCHAWCRQHTSLLGWHFFLLYVFFTESGFPSASWRWYHRHGDLTLRAALNTSTTSTKSNLNFRGSSSWFFENYNLRLGLCAIPISMKRCSKIYISSAVTGCHLFTLQSLEKLLLLKCWTAQHSDWSQAQISEQYPYPKIVKIYLQLSLLKTDWCTKNH
jgi:hypothetical protein